MNPTATILDEPLLNATAVAQLLAVSKSTVLRLARRGVLPCVYVGAQMRFEPADVRGYLATQKAKGGR